MAATFTIAGICGSLRVRSFNRALLAAAQELAPADVVVTILDVSRVPLYDADRDELAGGADTPEPVLELRRAIAEADALLLAVPEYNWGPSGVMKNLIDWASRPPASSPLRHKPIALAGTSPGPAGTGRAQLQLRQNLLFTKSYVLLEPDVMLGFARERFDGSLRLVDEEARALVRAQLEALVAWARGLPRTGA